MIKSSNKYFGIVKQIALTDFKLKYEGSALGYLWSLVKPLMLFSILYYVFTQFFKIGDAIPHYPAYLLLGIVMWSFFVEVTAVGLGAIVSKGDLMRKVYFPRIILVISNSMTAFLTFILNSAIVFIFMIFMHVIPSLSGLFFFLLIILELLVLVLGIALLLSAFYVKFRDLGHIWEVLLQFFFYAVPIVYPLNIVPDATAKIIMLNPIAQVIQDARFFLITDQTDTAFKVLGPYLGFLPYLLPFIIFFCGIRVFQKAAMKFAEEV